MDEPVYQRAYGKRRNEHITDRDRIQNQNDTGHYAECRLSLIHICLCKGFSLAAKLLQEERVFSSRDLPYSTQLIPLAAICTVLMDENRINTTTARNMVKQWYWCGVFGELYGSANETRYANDITQVIKWIMGNGDLPKTVTDFFFNPTRLLSLQSRQSAAYKGIMALILKNHARDFISG